MSKLAVSKATMTVAVVAAGAAGAAGAAEAAEAVAQRRSRHRFQKTYGS